MQNRRSFGEPTSNSCSRHLIPYSEQQPALCLLYIPYSSLRHNTFPSYRSAVLFLSFSTTSTTVNCAYIHPHEKKKKEVQHAAHLFLSHSHTNESSLSLVSLLSLSIYLFAIQPPPFVTFCHRTTPAIHIHQLSNTYMSCFSLSLSLSLFLLMHLA